MGKKYNPKTKPFHHQVRGLKKLWRDGRGALFWEPGTGKTKTALDFCGALYRHENIRRVLVIAPINALTVWPRQASLHLGVPYKMHIPEGVIAQKERYIADLTEHLTEGSSELLHIVVINYDITIKRDPQWGIMNVLEKFRPDVLILDESHKVKNATTKRAKAAHRLAQRVSHVVLMTGTPIANNYLDLYSQMKVIEPKIWEAGWSRTGIMTWTDFKNQYAKWGGRTGYELRGYQNLDDLRQRYKPYVSTARKRDCLDLPPTADVEIPVDMPDNAFKAFQIFGDEGIITYKGYLVEAPIPLTKLLRMRQMSGGWVQDEHGETFQWQSAKLDVFKDWLQDMKDAERKVLVFADFVPEMEAIVNVANTDLLI
ncbi:MAG: SNF2-related protein, partial [Nitrosopumilus sp.]